MNPTKDAMHVLLDMVVAFDDEADSETNVRAARIAFERFNEVGAVTATHDETDETTLHMTPLLTAAGMSIEMLLRQLAVELGQDRLAMLNTVRQHLDGVLDEDG